MALAAVLDPAELVPVVARALGLPAGEGAAGVEELGVALAEQRLLLVLDNMKHLLAAAGDIGHLVAASPGVTVLVSSRAPLRVRGETEHVVAPLALPGPDVRTCEDLRTSVAGALVLDRARAVAPAAVTTPEDVRALAELCRRLAGLPLAIELATAGCGSWPRSPCWTDCTT